DDRGDHPEGPRHDRGPLDPRSQEAGKADEGRQAPGQHGAAEAAPGEPPAMLPAEILRKVRRIEIRTSRLVNESLAGSTTPSSRDAAWSSRRCGSTSSATTSGTSTGTSPRAWATPTSRSTWRSAS